jgi:D-3-phosphoglycerate dehydrogenase / 2-oxoglutarate reductase
MTHVLVADSFPEKSLDRIRSMECAVHYHPGATAEELPDLLAESSATVLVVRSTRVEGEVFSRAPELELVIRAGAGVNTIDLNAASSRAVRVANCPGTNAAAVAELTMGLLLAVDRRIADNVIELRAGRWNKKGFSDAAGLAGATLGVIGTGSIGREVIRRALAFDMSVVAWSRSLTDETAAILGVQRAESIGELATMSDAVTVHLAATPETKGLLDGAFFGALREGAIFINTARSSVVDEEALRRAVRERGLRAGLDVFDGEPSGGTGTVDSSLFSDPGIYGTHHIGASTRQAQSAVADATVERIRAFVEGREVPSVVNVPEERSEVAGTDGSVAQIEVRHRNRVGVLAHVLTTLEEAGINVRGMSNRLFDGEEGALAMIQLEPTPDEKTLVRLQASHDDIIALRIS